MKTDSIVFDFIGLANKDILTEYVLDYSFVGKRLSFHKCDASYRIRKEVNGSYSIVCNYCNKVLVNSRSNRFLRRFDIWWLIVKDQCSSINSAKIDKSRPVIIIQNNDGNRCSETAIVAIISKNTLKTLPTTLFISKEKYPGLLYDSIIQFESITRVHKSELGKYICRLDSSDTLLANDRIRIALQLD